MPKDTTRTNPTRARRTPYARPAARPPAPNLGIWGRIKRFFWGQEQPTELGPPQLISVRDDDSYDDASRITHPSGTHTPSTGNRAEGSFASGGASPDPPSQLDTQSSFPSMGPGLPGVDAGLGPNEALEQFFAEKGDAELSSLEVVGALSLIGQAVSRNESLLDFSNLAESSRASIEPSEVSILRNLNAPPSPRSFLRGTPPSTTRSRASLTASQSPWTSPHPYLRQRPSFYPGVGLGGQSPRRPAQSPYQPMTRQSRGPRSTRANLPPLEPPTDRAHSSEPPVSRALPSQPRLTEPRPADSAAGATAYTPAASAILRALDQPNQASSPADTDSRAARRDRYVRESVAAKSPIDGDNDSSSEPASARPPIQPVTTPPFKLPGAQSSHPLNSLPFSLQSSTALAPKMPALQPAVQPQVSQTSVPRPSAPQSSAPDAQQSTSRPSVPKQAKLPSSTPESTGPDSLTSKSSTSGSTASEPSATQPWRTQGSEPKPPLLQTNAPAPSNLPEAAFEFEIPVSRTPREMTPAEEAIVAQTQAEFRF